MRAQDASSALGEALGLAPAEAAVYVHLCMAGPAKAADLAAALKLHRNEIYRGASRLLQRGLVEMTVERPARFAAVPAAEVFARAIRERAASVESLKAARDAVLPMLERSGLDAAPHRVTYKLVQGREEIFALRDRLVDAAQASIDWATSFAPSLSLTDLTGGLDRIASRVDAGVRFRGLFRADERASERLARLVARPGAQARPLAIEADVRFYVVDGEQLLMWVVNDPAEGLHARDEVAIHTTAPGFVQAEATFFEQLWSASQRPASRAVTAAR